MDAKTFEMNKQCMSDKIVNYISFRDEQAKFIYIAIYSQFDYDIATLTFDQENMHIDIVAHKDSLNALAANRN